MKTYVTIPKLMIAVLAIGACGYALHAWSKAQSPAENPSATLQVEVDLRLIIEPDAMPTEPGESEPAVVRARQAALERSARLLSEKNIAAPRQSALLPNYPNPFNPETWIPYELSEAADVSVSIYSTDGSLVRTLGLGHQVPGVYRSKSRSVYWDGRNDSGERVSSGVYFYTLEAGSFRATRKMLIVK